MIVDSNAGRVDLAHVFCLNETAAWLWQRIAGATFTPDDLTGWLCEEYEVSEETARKDVKKLLDDWERQGLALR